MCPEFDPVQPVEELLKAVYKAKLGFDEPSAHPCSFGVMHSFFPTQMRIWRDYVLHVELAESCDGDSLAVLRLKYAIREATRPSLVFDWDVKALDSAFEELRRDWRETVTSEAQVSPADLLTGKPREVYESYLAAQDALGGDATDDEAYEWVKENAGDGSVADRESWKRSLRTARKALGTQKRKRRALSTSRSIVKLRDLD